MKEKLIFTNEIPISIKMQALKNNLLKRKLLNFLKDIEREKT